MPPEDSVTTRLAATSAGKPTILETPGNLAAPLYLITTDEHVEAAVKGTANAAQNPAQHAHATKRRDLQPAMAANETTPACLGLRLAAKSCNYPE